MSLDTLIGLALGVIVGAFVVGLIAMRRQPRPGDRPDPARRATTADPGYAPMMVGYPASATDARHPANRDARPDRGDWDTPGSDPVDSPAPGDVGGSGGDSGGGGGGGDGGGD